MKEKNRWKTRVTLFFISQSITLFGSTIVQMAIVWYATLLTSSGVWVAAFFVCSYLPQFIISFIGGVWADRYNRKSLIVFSDASIAAVTLAVFFILPYLTDETSILGVLLAMSTIRSIAAGIQTPAVNAVVPQLVPEEYLMRCNGINAALQSVVQFAAPAAGGVILSALSLRITLLADVLTAAIGIGILSCIFIPYGKPLKEKLSVLEDMRLGIAYSFSDKLIGRLLVIYGLFVLLCVPGGYMAGLLVSRVYGNTYRYLTAVELAGFAGMTAGGLLMGIWGGFKSRIKTLIVGLFSFGLMAVCMGVAADFALYLVFMALYGVFLTMVQTATTTLIQENTSDIMQGKVLGLLSSVYSGFLPMGMVIFGPMADVISLQWIMIGSGIVLILIAAAVLLIKRK